MTIKFSNVIPFPQKEERNERKLQQVERTVYDMERELDEQMDIIMQQAEHVEKLSQQLLKL